MVEAYELLQGLMGANHNDEVRITDGVNRYDVDYVHTDNGYVEINIIPISKLDKMEDFR